MKNDPNIVIIDPIFRGSRLYYSYLAYKSCKMKATIWTRDTYETDHFKELFIDTFVDIKPVFKVHADKWFFKIDLKNTIKLFSSISKLRKETIIYMPGFNEWFPFLHLCMLFPFLLKNKNLVRMIAIDYEPHFLKKDNTSFNSVIKSFLMRIILKVNPFLKIGILDERIDIADKKSIFLLPDPGNIELRHKISVNQIEDKQKIVTLIGLQTQRKGFIKFYDQIEKHQDLINSQIKFKLVGRFDTATLHYREKVLSSSIWDLKEGFLSEQDIIREYEKTDFVCMPYSKTFNGSSGVLAYATALGKPVISTNHGLIGHRVTKNKLGFTYNFDDDVYFKELILSIKDITSVEYRLMAENCLNFSKKNSVEAHIEKLKKQLK